MDLWVCTGLWHMGKLGSTSINNSFVFANFCNSSFRFANDECHVLTLQGCFAIVQEGIEEIYRKWIPHSICQQIFSFVRYRPKNRHYSINSSVCLDVLESAANVYCHKHMLLLNEVPPFPPLYLEVVYMLVISACSTLFMCVSAAEVDIILREMKTEFKELYEHELHRTRLNLKNALLIKISSLCPPATPCFLQETTSFQHLVDFYLTF